MQVLFHIPRNRNVGMKDLPIRGFTISSTVNLRFPYFDNKIVTEPVTVIKYYKCWLGFFNAGELLLQVYPTTVRSLGLGSCSANARIGAMITPFIAEVQFIHM